MRIMESLRIGAISSLEMRQRVWVTTIRFMRRHSQTDHVLLTGVTGFVGQALLEKLLSAYPDCHVSVLIRPTDQLGADQRLAQIFSKSVFDTLKVAVGSAEFDAAVKDRISVISGDLTELTALPSDVGLVVHSASNVDFAAPIDEAFAANVAGPLALYRALSDSEADPHVVHVSTSYAVGTRRGVAEEESLNHTVDYRSELSHATQSRLRAEEVSRTPEVLETLVRQAHRQCGRAGQRAVADAAEQARVEWVRDQLSRQGRVRARSLGWWDVYTLTKALGERVAERMWADRGHRLSIVRPTIIESAFRHPYAGWIDGFKVADPLIAAYGRGQLPEFPALADAILDIIPVDFVVNACLAAGFAAGSSGQARYFQVSSGMSNPLRLKEVVGLTAEYFTAEPLDGAVSAVRNWTFPHPALLAGMVHARLRAVKVAERVVTHLPAVGSTRQWDITLQRAARDLELLSRMIALYQPYTQIEVTFDDARLRELHAGLPLDEQQEEGFDVTEIDWRRYLLEVHIPQIPKMMRRRATQPGPPNRDLPRRDDVLAVFDLQRTVAASSLVEHYLWFELAQRPMQDWPVSLVSLATKMPYYLWADQRDRSGFIRTFMRRYAGSDEQELRKTIAVGVADSLRRSLLVHAVDRIAAHREAGHRTVLITGQIDVFVEPVADLFDEVVAGSMEVDDNGCWTGHLASNPLVGDARADWLRRSAKADGMDLAASYAYGDSYADRPWLDLVGFPHAVNPDLRLHRYARQHRWPTYAWSETVEHRMVPILRSVRAAR
jgi:alcohol-forming fatty acyl-CoA reductase